MRVWDSQSAAGTSLALFSAMNEYQRVLFLKFELSRLLLVSKVYIIKDILHFQGGTFTEFVGLNPGRTNTKGL